MKIAVVGYGEPKLSKQIFASRASVPFWTAVRVYQGYLWLYDGWNRLSSPLWVGPDAGQLVTALLSRSLTLTGGEHPSVPAWYAWLVEHIFLPNAALLSHAVAVSAFVLGILLILGMFTGISAFLAGLLNASFLMAGIVFANPLMFILATWLVLAWRVAGDWGLDHWLLPTFRNPENKKSLRLSYA